MDFTEIGLEGVCWVRLIEDRDQWQAVVNVVMSFEFRQDQVLWNLLFCYGSGNKII
jgi:hypothetical protein